MSLGTAMCEDEEVRFDGLVGFGGAGLRGRVDGAEAVEVMDRMEAELGLRSRRDVVSLVVRGLERELEAGRRAEAVEEGCGCVSRRPIVLVLRMRRDCW